MLGLYQYLAKWTGKRYSVRTAVTALVAAILIPALMVGGWLTLQSADAERLQLEKNLHQQSLQIVSEIDREIVSTTYLLTALASSFALQTDNIEAFRRQALELSKKLKVRIVLRDPKRDAQIMNTAIEGPPPRLPGLNSDDEEVLRTKMPKVSNVFLGPVAKIHLVGVRVPVLRDGEVAYILSVGIPTDRFAEFLTLEQSEQGRIAAIVDRDNVFVARSQQHREFTGTAIRGNPASPGQAKGVVVSINRDGTPFHWFFRRSDMTGWVVAVGVPSSVLRATFDEARLRYSLAGGLLLILAVGISYALASWMFQSFGRLGIERQPTREEFRILFESAPYGVLLVDGSGVILLVNAVLEADFGYGRGELVGKPVELLIPGRFLRRHAKLLQGFSAVSEMVLIGADSGFFGLRKDGGEFPIEIGLNPINTPADNFVMMTVVNVSARQEAKRRLAIAAEALRASEEKLRLAIEAADLGTWSWDMVANRWQVSDRVREIVGMPLGETAARAGYLEHVHPSDRGILEENRNLCLAGQSQFDIEYRIVRPDDRSIRWLNSKGQVDFDAAGRPVLARGVIQDVTERKAAEFSRDDLRRQLMQAQEQERVRLAQELHDQTGQGLAAALMALKGLEGAGAEARADQIQSLRTQLEQMGQTLHRVAWELRPASIDELGLSVVLGEYVAEWGRQFEIKADFNCYDAGLNELPDDVRTTIYRVTQEALTNIAKHAKGATNASVVINRVAGVLRLTIEDNGPGLKSAAAGTEGRPRKGGLGLAGMRERLALIGGLLEIETTAEGTTIFARIPLEQERLSA